MNFIERIGEWLGRKEDEVEQNRNDYWREKYEIAHGWVAAKNQYILALEKDKEKAKEQIQNLEQEISELKDEIDVQKAKAAKYLSYYLEQLEKHAPND